MAGLRVSIPTFGRLGGGGVFLEQNAVRGAVEVFVLAASQRPEEGRQGDAAEKKRDGNQIEIVRHSAGARFIRQEAGWGAGIAARGAFKRWELPTTMTDDSDMASAAISGVTYPDKAMGTATAL